MSRNGDPPRQQPRPNKWKRKVIRLRQRDGDLCWLCNREMSFAEEDENRPWFRSVDHIERRADGGHKTSLDNMKLACRKCNTDRDIEFRKLHGLNNKRKSIHGS